MSSIVESIKFGCMGMASHQIYQMAKATLTGNKIPPFSAKQLGCILIISTISFKLMEKIFQKIDLSLNRWDFVNDLKKDDIVNKIYDFVISFPFYSLSFFVISQILKSTKIVSIPNSAIPISFLPFAIYWSLFGDDQ